MTSAVLDSWLWVPVESVDLKQVGRLLTLKPKRLGRQFTFADGKQAEAVTELEMSRISDGLVGLPRAWGLSVNPGSSQSDQRSFRSELPMAPVSAVLRDDQSRVVESAVAMFGGGFGTPGCIVEGLPGKGKTVVMLAIAARLGLTTLVIVNSTALLRQWAERIEQFLGIPASEVGIVRQARRDSVGKQVAVGLAQSIVKDRYGDDWKSYWGTVIYDECDLFPTTVFRKALSMFPAAFRVAGTATLERRDGMTDLLRWHVGPVAGQMMRPDVIPVVYPLLWPGRPAERFTFSRVLPDGSVETKASYAKLMSGLMRNRARNLWLGRYIVKANLAKRKVLALAHHQEALRELRGVLVDVLGIDPDDVGYFMGSESPATLAESKKKPIILGTYRMMGRGIDIPDIDVEVFVQPVADIRQSVGRVLRSSPGKKQPIVLDPVDVDIEACLSMYRSRCRLYNEIGAVNSSGSAGFPSFPRKER